MKYGMLGVAALLSAFSATQASAQTGTTVRDAVYRGTLVCDKLPFFETTAREALEVTIAGSAAKYVLIVRERKETSFEQGAGKLDGENITLTGSWSGETDKYESSYSGTFVRRSATLNGTQTWTHDGKSFTRKCSGVIKRPFAVFLPKDGEKK